MNSSEGLYFPGTYAPCRTYEIDISGEIIPSWVALILVIIIVIILVVSEYVAHDCVPHKTCNHSAPKPEEGDDIQTYIQKIGKMVENNYDYVIWRQALLVGLLLPLILVYYLRGRLPTLMEWVIVGLIIFIGVYLAHSWIWAHFFYPNGQSIKKYLQELSDRINNNSANDLNYDSSSY